MSLVSRGANRRRILLRKSDEPLEFADMLSVPHEHEGAVSDYLRKEGVADESIDALIGGIRLLKASSDDMPTPIRELVEKLGSQMYPIVNKPLNNMEGSDTPTSGVNDDADSDMDGPTGTTDMCKAGGSPLEKADDPDEDWDDDSHENDSDGTDVAKADLSTTGRQAMANRGQALPDGSFPIPNVGYLRRAIRAFGRAGDKPRAKAWIMRRARALGRTDLLPDSWKGGGSDDNVKKGGHEMSEGTAVSVPIRKDDGSWDLSGVPEENRPFFETFTKALDDAQASSTELRKELAEAREDVTKERDARITSGFVQKAEGYGHLFEDPAAAGPVLKKIADALDEEEYALFEKALDSANEQIEKGGLYTENGRASGPVETPSNAWDAIEKMAEDMVEKDSELTNDQAVDKVLKTAKGRDLYAAYLAEMGSGVN